MQFSTILPILLAAAVSTSAAPTANIAKREIGGVLICQGVNATGTCAYSAYTMEDCHDLPDNLSGNAATFAPDGDNFYCYPKAGKCADICTSPTGCTFGAVSFDSPVKYDLTSIKWQTLLKSFTCHLNTTTTA
ncbi:uncharacterized protein BCR38DRAFT_419960 [Pseudomassariella vexata]|uniref:Uncharacterized protein n=1 Tax=Pseudomassariella vexata TaxID=1141098 RepID=A0A1Y2EDT3_9PEZI|nr:uncharacterized protein BCR38DRAFT_419960 [Pseudomassariella vexata]ORY69738.1 hypothetical protein BCR38DRAFT_419960 [Pseudomassariella vexata]